MCVFITAEPGTKQCAWGRRIVEAGRPFFRVLINRFVNRFVNDSRENETKKVGLGKPVVIWG